ncbi:helix-turn-helix transcriptional regulator [Bradyrhizobium daqingense]|uniref:Putative ATPase n=1 Tax=Bradyrhizobium daqingense TaxID=993502 RepID=A0A562KRH0_9BRAD|nr:MULTISPECIES: winged helix-turn-helix domain-containing protein [Bradyrhizobium]MDQ8731713.1 winged helix-turn-helix domain-containing protein [Bradyrhizobium sp. LHD-71]TWH97937.1 putative ATPase [Bradyrhizobium daqingense]UFS91562.1 helix-turn-helix transcriptional regulator [Bradyrhizobium daqingense]
MASRWQSKNGTATAGSSVQEEAARETFVFGPFRLDAEQRRIARNGEQVQLSARAFDILLTLIRHAGTVVSKSDLMARAWPHSSVDENSLRVHIAALRKALGDGHAGDRYLSTVSGQGYCFVGSISKPDETQPEPSGLPYAHNLPAHPRHMVGREQTIREISERLRAQRFVTVVGPGGIGKTTAAVSVGYALLAEFAGQVHFVSLGENCDAVLVPAVTAASFGLPARSNDPSAGLASLLRGRHMLLILDCCEHVIDAAAALAEQLFQEAPELHILATSRELLRVEGEHAHRLLPLASPPEKASLTAASALAYPAIELFVERATSGGSEFALTDANAWDVGNLCRRLDGIPLAIELTAGHVGAYGAGAMVRLLDEHFNLLWEGRRTALPRHRTLRATIEWSYNLLSEAEREVLDRLSVFVGSFSLDAAQAIVATAKDDDAILAIIDSLVAKSMLASSVDPQLTRYRLLDATRVYGQERLAAQNDADEMARRHAAYFLALLENTDGAARDGFPAATDQFGNVRSALAWCFSDRGDRGIGIALTAAAIPLFFKLSLLTECEHWAARAIEALDETAESARRSLALYAALGTARTLTGQFDDLAMTCLNRALALAEKIGDLSGQVRLIDRLHLLQLLTGKFHDALKTARRGESIALESGDPGALSRMHLALGISCHYLGELAASRAYIEAAMSRFGATKDVGGEPTLDYPGRAPITLGRILWLQGYPDRAVEIARKAVSDALTMDHPTMLCRALVWAFDVFYWNEELESYEDSIDRLLAESRTHKLATLEIVAEAMKGIALLTRGTTGPGLAMLKGSVEKLQNRRFGAVAGLSVPLAAALVAANQGGAALDTINQAIAQAGRCGFLMEMPDMLRVKAEALIRKATPDMLQAEQNLAQSLELARQQGALGYELRTATMLARLRQRQGRYRDAEELLAPVYGRFTEGFGTRSLKTASDLLTELRFSRSDRLAGSW